MMNPLANMMHAQLKVQAIINPKVPPINKLNNTEDRLEQIRYNYIALVQELSEAMDECGWKSWATSKHINEDKMFAELRDVWQFLTNLMFLATQLTPDELALRLETELYTKHAINVERAQRGYDGVAGKCPGCKRALDEVTLKDVQRENGTTELVFCECGYSLDLNLIAPYLLESR